MHWLESALGGGRPFDEFAGTGWSTRWGLVGTLRLDEDLGHWSHGAQHIRVCREGRTVLIGGVSRLGRVIEDDSGQEGGVGREHATLRWRLSRHRS